MSGYSDICKSRFDIRTMMTWPISIKISTYVSSYFKHCLFRFQFLTYTTICEVAYTWWGWLWYIAIPSFLVERIVKRYFRMNLARETLELERISCQCPCQANISIAVKNTCKYSSMYNVLMILISIVNHKTHFSQMLLLMPLCRLKCGYI